MNGYKNLEQVWNTSAPWTNVNVSQNYRNQRINLTYTIYSFNNIKINKAYLIRCIYGNGDERGTWVINRMDFFIFVLFI